LRGITAAVVGVITNLAVWFGLRVLFGELQSIEVFSTSLLVPVWSSINLTAVGLSLAAALLLFLTRLGLFGVVGLAALAGWLVGLAH
jgi:chromate transporter